MPIIGEQSYPKQKTSVGGHQMAFVETGSGDPIVFIHGNPTSSYLWRNIIPHMEGMGRCIAPDLIGFGDSDKLPGKDPGRYSFFEHRKFLQEFLEKVGATENVTIVIHDWGSALGFDWANRNRECVKAIAYMEAIIKPITENDLALDEFQADNEFDFDSLLTWYSFRDPEGEELVLEQNLFVEQCLPAWILRNLSEEEMNHYRRPFRQSGEGRRTQLTLARQVPIEGKPEDIFLAVESYSQWMCENQLPKLLIAAKPGMLIAGPMLEYARSWPNQKEVTVRGIHFIQEDSPDEIGQTLADWYQQL